MSRYTGPACKLCRREGESICGSAKCALLKKNYAPGMHGNKASMGKKSEYSRQLREKQKTKRMYGLTETQFRNIYKAAEKKTGQTGKEFLRLLESRMDNALYMSGIASTRRQARQMVSHGLFKINGRRIKTPSALVKPGMKVELREKLLKSPIFAALAEKKPIAAHWLKADYKQVSFEVISFPSDDDLPKNVESSLIVELYSK